MREGEKAGPCGPHGPSQFLAIGNWTWVRCVRRGKVIVRVIFRGEGACLGFMGVGLRGEIGVSGYGAVRNVCIN